MFRFLYCQHVYSHHYYEQLAININQLRTYTYCYPDAIWGLQKWGQPHFCPPHYSRSITHQGKRGTMTAQKAIHYIIFSWAPSHNDLWPMSPYIFVLDGLYFDHQFSTSWKVTLLHHTPTYVLRVVERYCTTTGPKSRAFIHFPHNPQGRPLNVDALMDDLQLLRQHPSPLQAASIFYCVCHSQSLPFSYNHVFAKQSTILSHALLLSSSPMRGFF